jgi:glutamate-1-semialdehyde 2,1-aminomutase
MKFEKSQQLRQRVHSIIPGGSHTYAKGDDQFPENAPGYIVRGSGSHVWDIDGNEFIEYGMGLRAVTLGHAYLPVLQAAHSQMLLGTNFARPSIIELECAEALLNLIPGAEMVKFGKNGSDATSAAIRLSRAYTGRPMIAICENQPFFSVDDWFIGSTPMAAGIPEQVRDLTVKFRYNDLESLQALFERYPQKIACVIMEAATYLEPSEGYLEGVRESCTKAGAVFVLDEIITGFRWHLGGAQQYYKITPDLSAFGKAIANGFSASALVGKRDLMRLGGCDHDRERVFLLSLTHGAETHSLAAVLATINTYKENRVIEMLYEKGDLLRQGIQSAIRENRVEGFFEVLGKSPNLIYATRDQQGQPSQPFRTLFLQETIQRGLILPNLVVSIAHSAEDISRTVHAIADSLHVYRKALDEGVTKYLTGRPVKPAIRQFS